MYAAYRGKGTANGGWMGGLEERGEEYARHRQENRSIFCVIRKTSSNFPGEGILRSTVILIRQSRYVQCPFS
jgi:hypothetical protein